MRLNGDHSKRFAKRSQNLQNSIKLWAGVPFFHTGDNGLLHTTDLLQLLLTDALLLSGFYQFSNDGDS